MSVTIQTKSIKSKQTKAESGSSLRGADPSSSKLSQQRRLSQEMLLAYPQNSPPSPKKYLHKSDYFPFTFTQTFQQDTHHNSLNLRLDKADIKEVDLKLRNYSLNRHQFSRPFVSEDESIVEIVVYISYYSIRIRIKNLFEESPEFGGREFTEGGFGKCFKVGVGNQKKYCLKQILFKKPELFVYGELETTIKEVAIYKLASQLGIAPEFKSIRLVDKHVLVQEEGCNGNTHQEKQKDKDRDKDKEKDLFDIVVYSSCAIFLSELCVPLYQYLQKQRGEEPTALVNKINLNISKCLQQLHFRNIVHRDIKPMNIVWSNRLKQFVLCDFGLTHSVNSTCSRIKNFEGTIKYSLPEMQQALKENKETYINLYQNDKYALKLTLLQCKRFINSNTTIQPKLPQQIIPLQIPNKSYGDYDTKNTNEIRFQFLKRIYGFNKEIHMLWEELIIEKKPLLQQILKENLLLTSEIKKQLKIFNLPFLKKYENVHLNILLQKNDVDEIVVIQQSQGYINYALQNLNLCLQALRNQEHQNYKKQLNFMVAMINIQKEYYFRLDHNLMEEFAKVLEKYQGENKIVYQLMHKLYSNKSQDYQFFEEDFKEVERLSENCNRPLLKLIEKLLFFVVDFGYDNRISRIQVKIFQLVLRIRRRYKMVFDYELGEIYAKIGKTYSDFQYMSISQAIMKEILKNNNMSAQFLMGEVHQSKGYYYHKAHQWMKCEEESEKARKIYETNFNTHSLSYAMTLNNCSHYLQNKGQDSFHKVIEYREKSLKLRETNVGVKTLRYCICLFDLISVYEHQKNQSKLDQLYSKLKAILFSLRDIFEQKPFQNVGRLIQFYYKATCKIDEYQGWHFVNPTRFFGLAAYYLMVVEYDTNETLSKRKQLSRSKLDSMSQHQKITLLYTSVKDYGDLKQFPTFCEILYHLVSKVKSNTILEEIEGVFPQMYEGWKLRMGNTGKMKLPYFLDELI